MIMNKSDLIKAIAGELDITEAKSKEFYEAFVASVLSGLTSDGVVDLGPDMGKFMVTHRAARQGVNPRTGEKMAIAASNSVKFKSGKRIKEKVND